MKHSKNSRTPRRSHSYCDPGAEAGKYIEMLTRFYQKHDPSRVGAGVAAIVDSFITKGGEPGHGPGIDQLNRILTEKYGEDLNTRDLLFNFHDHNDHAANAHAAALESAADTAARDAEQDAAKAAALEQMMHGMSRLDTQDSFKERRPKSGKTFAQLQAERAARGQNT